MLPRQRQAYILEAVRATGGVKVNDLVRELGVSDMTIRRDLSDLAGRGLLEKVHGGAAALTESGSFEPEFRSKLELQFAEKEAIAAEAAKMVEPGSTIGISAGTTTHALTRRIVHTPGITVVTNSIPAAETLYRNGRDDQTVLLTGGMRTPSDALVGTFAVCAIEDVNLEIAFLGVHGMDSKAGFTTPNHLEADTNRALIGSARRVVVLADATKWGVIGVASMAPLSAASALVTDASISPSVRRVLEREISTVVLAQPFDGEASH